MTLQQVLGSYNFVKYKSEGCNCNSQGKADVYKQRASGVELKVYPKSRKFKLMSPSKGSRSGNFSELANVLKVFMAA